jgi:hypothetical protein
MKSIYVVCGAVPKDIIIRELTSPEQDKFQNPKFERQEPVNQAVSAKKRPKVLRKPTKNGKKGKKVKNNR